MALVNASNASPAAAESVKEARRLMAEAALDRAISLLARSIREIPNSFHLHITRCEAYLRKRDRLLKKLAEKDFEIALNLAPPEADAHQLLLEPAARLGALERLGELYSTQWVHLPFAADQKKMLAASSASSVSAAWSVPAAGTAPRWRLYGLTVIAAMLIGGVAIYLGTKRGVGPAGSPGFAAPRVLPWLRTGADPVSAFSTDGKYLATGAAEGVKIREVSSGKVAISIDDIKIVRAVSYSPNGRLMVVSGYAVGRGACIRIYEAGLGNPLHVIEGRIATSVTWAPDGNRFSSICQSDTKLYVSDAANGTDVLTITCHGNGVNDEAWAPNGKCIVTCGKDSIINAWDASSGTLMWAIPQGEDGAKVDRICCAPDGRLVAGAGSWSKNTNLNIWDGDKGTLLGSAYVGMGGVSAIAADPSGRLIASASFQYTEETSVKLWMLKENLEFRWSVKMESTVCSLAFSPDGLFLAVGVVPGIVHLYDLKSFTEVSGGM